MPELNDSLAWMVAGGTGLLLLLCMWFLTRNLNWWWLKWVLRLTPPVALLLPAGVPGQPGFYAPAFLVAPFEAFLQSDGKPDEALARLILVVGGVVGVITLVAIVRWARNRTAVSAPGQESDADTQPAPAERGDSKPVTQRQEPVVS